MEPYAGESFSEELLRSEVFRVAPEESKNQALWLMLLAFFCDRLSTTSRRVELFVDSCSERKIALELVQVETFCRIK
jgi:hypothetical protein